jgi:hypothetical protein
VVTVKLLKEFWTSLLALGVILSLSLAGCFGGVNPNALKGSSTTDTEEASIPTTLTLSVVIPENVSNTISASQSSLTALAMNGALQAAAADDDGSSIGNEAAAPDGTKVQLLNYQFKLIDTVTTKGGTIEANVDSANFIHGDHYTFVMRTITPFGSSGHAVVQMNVVSLPQNQFVGNTISLGSIISPASTFETVAIFDDLDCNPLNPNLDLATDCTTLDSIMTGAEMVVAKRILEMVYGFASSGLENLINLIVVQNNGKPSSNPEASESEKAELDKTGNTEIFDYTSQGLTGDNVHYLNMEWSLNFLHICHNVLIEDPPNGMNIWDVERCLMTGNCSDPDAIMVECGERIQTYVLKNSNYTPQAGDTEKARTALAAMLGPNPKKIATFIDAITGIWIHFFDDLEEAPLKFLIKALVSGFETGALNVEAAQMWAEVVKDKDIYEMYASDPEMADALYEIGHTLIDQKSGVGIKLLPNHYKSSVEETTQVDKSLDVDFNASKASNFKSADISTFHSKVTKVRRDEVEKVREKTDLANLENIKVKFVRMALLNTKTYFDGLRAIQFPEAACESLSAYCSSGIYGQFGSNLLLSVVATIAATGSIIDSGTNGFETMGASLQSKGKDSPFMTDHQNRITKIFNDVVEGYGFDCAADLVEDCTAITSRKICQKSYTSIHAINGDDNSVAEFNNCNWWKDTCRNKGDFGSSTQCWGGQGVCGNGICDGDENPIECAADCSTYTNGDSFGTCWDDDKSKVIVGSKCNCHDDCKSGFCDSSTHKCSP